MLVNKYTIISSLLGIFLFLANPVFASQSDSITYKRPKVALVLSGGGAKGFSHIGVLKVLEEEGIPVDIVVGTSIGSLVGGIYAMGYSADEIYRIAKAQKWDALLTDEVPRAYLSRHDQMIRQRYLLSLDVGLDKKIGLPQALKKGQNVMNLFCGLAGNVPSDMDFAKLPIPFACVAADLQTGEEVVLKDGFLPTAMFSSMAIPTLFQSPQRDQRTLIDGGVVNNFPVDVAREMGADIIIGVDLQRDPPKKNELNSMDVVLNQLVAFMSKEKYAQNLRMCDILIRPDVSKYSMLAFTGEALDSLNQRGREAADEYREEFRRIKAKYHLEPNVRSRQYIMPDKWHIENINFRGNYTLDEEFLKSMMGLELPGNFSYREIKSAIDRIYGLGGFERIYFDLTGDESKTLNLDVIPQKVKSQNLGFKANTTDAAALMFNISKKSYGKRFTLLSGNAEFSANPGLSLIAESSNRNFMTLGAEVKGKYQHINVFEEGHKAFNIDIFYASASAYLYQAFLSKCNAGIGVKEEFFKGDIFSKNDYQQLSPDKSTFWVTNPYIWFSLDNLDSYYFPTKGTNLYTEFSLNTDLHSLEKMTPTLLIRMNNTIPVSHKVALQTAFYSRMLFNKEYPLAKITMVGGESYSQYFNHHLPFIGLPPVMLAERYAYIGSLGARYRLSENKYLSVVLNELLQTDNAIRNLNFSSVFGGGVKYSIKTAVGPLDIGVGLSDLYKRPTFSANLGFWF